jgi:hypothetical protein
VVEHPSSTGQFYKVFKLFYRSFHAHPSLPHGGSFFLLFCCCGHFTSSERAYNPETSGEGKPMTLETPHLIYIVAAYSLTLLGVVLFLAWTIFQWKKSILHEKVSRETKTSTTNSN